MQSPANPRVLTLLRRVYSGSYDRLTAANPPESHPPSGEMQPDHGEGAGIDLATI
jgi:hypothetical protein